MQGIGQGTVLGGRYALQHRVSHDRELERWHAHDTTLLREVTLTVIRSDHPRSAGVLDAARRAAGVGDTRLVRILDVGAEKEISFIVEETMQGAESLATLLLQGPLPAEEARRVAGETAKGLETAGRRGLHHLRLTPHYVMVAPDGVVRLSGVAVAGSITGPDEQELDAVTASRRDAVCLVAVVYAALTGRWPLDEPVPGVEAAPRVADGPVAPSEIATGVPGDLDALCRMTLNQASGPLTPGDFAHRIAPWPRERTHRDGVDPTVVLKQADVADGAGGPAVARRMEPTVTMSTTGAVSKDSSGEGAQPVPGPDRARPASVTVKDKAASAGTATTKAFGAVVSGAGAAAGAVGGTLSSLARTAGQKPARTDADPQSERVMPVGLSNQPAEVEPPLPLLPASTALPPSRGQTKVVVLVVALFVALALFVGFRGLLSPVSGSSLSIPTPKRAAAAAPPPAAAPSSPASPTQSVTAEPVAILSATGFDPEGDQQEGNSQAARVYDGDPGTSWNSELYATADFGNLKKGLGVLLDLGQPTSVHQVTIDLGNGPVDVRAYAATEPSLQDATVIGKAGGANGQIDLKAAKTMPRAQYVIVWFTSLAPDNGLFRASISEIALS